MSRFGSGFVVSVATSFFFFLVLSTSVHGQTETQLFPSVGGPSDFFGTSVAIHDDFLLVGTDRDDTVGTDSGAVYAFEHDGVGWNETQILIASDALAGDRFGGDTAIDDDVAIVSAVGVDAPVGAFVGAAYVFRRTAGSWIEEDRLQPPVLEPSLFFGRDVDVSGDVIVVGETGSDDVANDSGAVHVFRYDGTAWNHEQRLKASTPQFIASFGSQIAVDGDWIVVGAASEDLVHVDQGTVYVFHFDGTSWNEVQKLTASDAAPSDLFGVDVDIFDDVCVVGASREDDGVADSGAAYVFRRTAGVFAEEQKLDPAVENAMDEFGQVVAISGERIVVGTRLDDTLDVNAGCAYVFERNGTTWTEERHLLASNGLFGDAFGRTVAVDGDRVLVGAIGADPLGASSGAAYVYEIPKLYPGSGEDLVLRSGVDGRFDGDDLKPIAAGDTLRIGLTSPGGTLATFPYIVVGQLFSTGNPPNGPLGFPEVHLDPNGTPEPIILLDGLATIFGTTLIPTDGVAIQIGVPSSIMSGTSFLIQGVSVVGPAASNGFFAITHGHELRFI